MDSLSTKTLSVERHTKGKLPGLPFVELKNNILGKEYSLSISFLGLNRMKELSVQFKGNENHTNILSFPYEKNEGEILMNLLTVRKQCKKHDLTYKEHLLFLVIHGMLHLKGYKHGSTMEKQEDIYFSKFYKKIT